MFIIEMAASTLLTSIIHIRRLKQLASLLVLSLHLDMKNQRKQSALVNSPRNGWWIPLVNFLCVLFHPPVMFPHILQLFLFPLSTMSCLQGSPLLQFYPNTITKLCKEGMSLLRALVCIHYHFALPSVHFISCRCIRTFSQCHAYIHTNRATVHHGLKPQYKGSSKEKENHFARSHQA